MAGLLDDLFVAAGGQPHLLATAAQAEAQNTADGIATLRSRLSDLLDGERAAFTAQCGQLLRSVDAAGKAASSVTAKVEDCDAHVQRVSGEPWDNLNFWVGLAAAAAENRAAVPRLLRVGTLSDVVSIGNGKSHRLDVPALIPLFGHASVVFSAAGARLDSARDAMSGLLLRALAALPAGRVRLTLADHAHKGQAFSNLLELHKTIRGDMVWHEPRDIGEAIKGLIEHMSTVIQKYLTNQYADLEAYNAAAVDLVEPYRILAIADFPAGFDKNLADRVLSIARNGRRVGVYVIMTIDEQAAVPHGFNLDELERICTVLRFRDNHFRWLDPVLANARIRFDGPPTRAAVDRIVEVLSSEAVRADRVKVEYTRFVPAKLWQDSSKDGLVTPIGRRGARDDQLFELGLTQGLAHHALVAGRTGMGKSVLLHALIMGLCLRYSPWELELYLVDFKEGVEFELYRRLPHARVVAIESEREFGLSVLEGLRDEINSRGERYKRVGATAFADFRQKSTDRLPRVLLIVDEFQIFFERSDRLSTTARALLDDVTRRGRSFGIHALLSSQTISSGVEHDLDATTLAQMGLRIALALNDSDSQKVLSRDNDAARFLERPGEAIYNDKAGLIGGNSRFQVAYLGGEQLTVQLDAIVAHANAGGFERRPLIFEGNRPAKITDNRELVTLVGSRPSSMPRAMPLFLGEPTTIQERHVAFRLRRQSRSNLLILGQNESELLSVFLSVLASFAIGVPPCAATLHILNLANIDDPLHELLEVCQAFDQGVQLGGRKMVVQSIETVHEALVRRNDQVGGAEQSMQPIVLAIFGLQRATKLHREGMSTPDAAKKLARILRDGPDVAIHSIIAADTHGGFLRCLETKDISEFDGRVVLSSGDGGRVLGEQATGFKLKAGYGVLFEPERSEPLQKFKVYEHTIADWIRNTGKGIKTNV